MDRRQFLYLVVDEKQLAAAVEFIVYDAPDLILVEKDDFCLGRDPVRRSVDDG